MATTPNPTARASRSFWAIVVIAVLATGALSAGLTAHASPAAGTTVAVSGAVLAVALTLAARILIALDHARRGTQESKRSSMPPPGSRGRRRVSNATGPAPQTRRTRSRLRPRRTRTWRSR